MELTYLPIEGKTKRYQRTVWLLAIVALSGLVCFGISYVSGHQEFGSSNAIPWGMPIVLAIYLIGLSAGSLILSSLTYVFGREEYKPIARVAVFLAIVLIFGAMVSIAVDLGRPEKFWRLFTFGFLSNMTSMFAINGILYGGYFLISLFYLSFIFANKTAVVKKIGILAVSWAVLVHMGTGAIFGFIAAREAWFSPLRPLEFLTAALTSGLALLILVVVLTLKLTGREVKKSMVASLGSLLTLFIGVLLVLVFVDKLTHLYAPAREAAAYMLAGPYAWIFWGFQIGLGAVIPLAILAHPRFRKTIIGICVAAAGVVVGVFFERFYLVIPGASFPLALYPGKIEGIWGVSPPFPITPVETILSVGIMALLGLVFVLGLRYLDLLPAGDSSPTPEKPPTPVATTAPVAEQAK